MTAVIPARAATGDAPHHATPPNSGTTDKPGRRVLGSTRSRATAGVVVAVVAGVVLYGTLSGGAEATEAAPAVATSTAKVTTRDLVITEDLSGDLGYADARDLSALRSGVVTSVAAVGSTLGQGKVLYTIDLEPTVLLTGSVPAFRALSTDSTDGPDVKQLETALTALGYGDDLTVDESFTSSTADAVEEWEDDLGRTDPDGTVDLGDVVFADGSVRVASHEATVGTQVQSTSAVVGVTSTTKVVTIDLEASRADIVAVKDAVTVSLPDGKDTAGRIQSIGTQPETLAGNDSETVPVIVTLDDAKAAGSFDSGSVDVAIERSRDDDVLAVPVTALVALAEGGYALQVVDDTQASGHKLVAVEVGTVTDAYVAVTGDGIAEGTTVVVPA